MENLHPNQTTTYDFLPKEKKTMSDKSKLKSIKSLIERWRKEIEELKQNEMFEKESRTQLSKGLELYVFDLEMIMDIK